MEQIAFFDTKPYDRTWFDQLNHRFRIRYFEHKLTPDSVSLAQGCSAVIPFVNDNLSAPVIEDLYRFGVKVIALRCAGYNNVAATLLTERCQFCVCRAILRMQLQNTQWGCCSA